MTTNEYDFVDFDAFDSDEFDPSETNPFEGESSWDSEQRKVNPWHQDSIELPGENTYCWTEYQTFDDSFIAALRVADAGLTDEEKEAFSWVSTPEKADFDALDDIITTIEALYDISFPKEVRQKLVDFTNVFPRIVFTYVDVTEGYSCEYCGYNSDSFELTYVPAVNETPSSVQFMWNYGCYSGVELRSKGDEKLGEVRERLEQILELHDILPDAREEVQSALDALPQVK
jgi:hypothetical protein